MILLSFIILLSCTSAQKNITQNSNYSFLGKDTSVYCQTNSPWVANCYSFYKVDKLSSSGIFENTVESDDGQHWRGKGRFTEYENKISIDSFRLIRTLKKNSDTTVIPSFNFIKEGDKLTLYRTVENTKVFFAKQNHN